MNNLNKKILLSTSALILLMSSSCIESVKISDLCTASSRISARTDGLPINEVNCSRFSGLKCFVESFGPENENGSSTDGHLVHFDSLNQNAEISVSYSVYDTSGITDLGNESRVICGYPSAENSRNWLHAFTASDLETAANQSLLICMGENP